MSEHAQRQSQADTQNRPSLFAFIRNVFAVNATAALTAQTVAYPFERARLLAQASNMAAPADMYLAPYSPIGPQARDFSNNEFMARNSGMIIDSRRGLPVTQQQPLPPRLAQQAEAHIRSVDAAIARHTDALRSKLKQGADAAAVTHTPEVDWRTALRQQKAKQQQRSQPPSQQPQANQTKSNPGQSGQQRQFSKFAASGSSSAGGPVTRLAGGSIDARYQSVALTQRNLFSSSTAVPSQVYTDSPSWSFFEALKNMSKSSQRQGLGAAYYRGASTSLTATAVGQISGVSLLLPLVVSAISSDIIQTGELRMCGAHIIAAAQAALAMYPLGTITIRRAVQREVIPNSVYAHDIQRLRKLYAQHAKIPMPAPQTPPPDFQKPTFTSLMRDGMPATSYVWKQIKSWRPFSGASVIDSTVRDIKAQEGWKGFYKGFSLAAASCLLYGAVYTPVYYVLNKTLTDYAMREWASEAQHVPIPSSLKTSLEKGGAEATDVPTLASIDGPTQLSLAQRVFGVSGKQAAAVLAPALTASFVAQAVTYPLSTLRTCYAVSGDIGYHYTHGFSWRSTLSQTLRRIMSAPKELPTSTQFRASPDEPLPQGLGIRNLWRGFSVVPFVRMPLLTLQSLVCMWGIKQVWPEGIGMINVRHNTQHHQHIVYP